MIIRYDEAADALYIKLGRERPDGVIEVSDNVNLDSTADNKIVGIEILHASRRMNLKTIFSYELEIEKKVLKKIA